MKYPKLKKSTFLLSLGAFLVTSCTPALVNETTTSLQHNPNESSISNAGLTSARKRHMHYSFRSDSDDTDIWYSDEFFSDSSTKYNPHLAALSIQMSKYSMNPGNPNSPDDSEWYQQQPDRVHAFFTAIGFGNFEANEDYRKRTEFDTIGVAAAARTTGIADTTIIALTIRSGGYFREWENNVFLGDGSNSDMMHEGWYNAANKAIDFLTQYISKKQITGRIKLWASGFSRGAATINILAGLLDSRIDNDGKDKVFDKCSLAHDDLYAYTFETPQGANINSKNVKHPRDEIYNNIFNIINPNDFVTKVAMARIMGFTRFGIDRFIVTQFFDPDGFEANRKSVKAIYNDIKPGSGWSCDNLQMYNLSFINALISFAAYSSFAGGIISALETTGVIDLPDIITKDDTKQNYDSNILMTLVIDYVTAYIGSRSLYASIYQTPARLFVKLAMNDVGGLDEATMIVDAIVKLILGTLSFGIFNDIGLFADWFDGKTYDLSQLTPLVGAIACLLADYPNELVSVFANIGDIFDNHSTDINVAHIKSQDSLYVDDYNSSHSDDPIQVNSLRTSASFKRVFFKDFNDLGLYNQDDNGRRVVSVDGTYVGASTISQCDIGYAVGYYSFTTEEHMELFFPACHTYKLNYTDYSKKLYHTVWAEGKYYRMHSEMIEAGKYYTEKFTICDDWAVCGTDTYSWTFHANEQPE